FERRGDVGKQLNHLRAALDVLLGSTPPHATGVALLFTESNTHTYLVRAAIASFTILQGIPVLFEQPNLTRQTHGRLHILLVAFSTTALQLNIVMVGKCTRPPLRGFMCLLMLAGCQ